MLLYAFNLDLFNPFPSFLLLVGTDFVEKVVEKAGCSENFSEEQIFTQKAKQIGERHIDKQLQVAST
jgi:hypothetical protein